MFFFCFFLHLKQQLFTEVYKCISSSSSKKKKKKKKKKERKKKDPEKDCNNKIVNNSLASYIQTLN